MINLIIWPIAGAIVGWLTTKIMHRRQSILLLNIVVGSVGAFVAGYLLAPVFHISTSSSFSLPGLLVAVAGAIGLLAVVNFFVREHTKTNKAIEGHWDLVRDKIHARWSKITEEDIDQINGNHEQLINLIVERYGMTKEEAEDQLQRFLLAVDTKSSWTSFLHSRA